MVIGQKINKWTVLKQVQGKRRGKHFECQCDCGYIKVISNHVLKNGKSKQCQVCQKQAVINKGDIFGAWQVIEEVSERTNWGGRKYKCQCKCFAIKIIAVGDLRSGKSTQCISCHIRKKSTAHGLSKTLTYRCWAYIISRCINKNNKDYNSYGGRGIKVYSPWNKFENFVNNMGEKPPGMEIDRIDPDGNYEPSNCRWASRQQNVNNRRMSALNRDKYVLVCLSKLCKSCCKLISL